MNTSVQSDVRERLGIMPNRYLAYASDETHGKAERAHVRRARGAGGASFAKKSQIWHAGGLISHLRWSIGSEGELRFGRCRAVGAARREK